VNEQEQQLPTQARAALEDCFARIRLARATELAQSKRFLEAEAVLIQNGELPPKPRELDLLARIAVHKGQFAQARRLWQAVLEKEPTDEPAKTALAKLNSPWIALWFIRRFALLAGIAALLSLSAVGLLALFYGFLLAEPPAQMATVARPPKSPEQIHTLAANPSTMPQSLEALEKQQRDTQQLLEQARNENQALKEAYARAAQTATNSPIAPQRSLSLNFQIKGISLIPQQDAWILRFDTGLFDRDDHFKIGSKALLKSIGKAIVQTQEKLRVEVVGFAENEPPTWPWSKPKDEAALGLVRAERVKHFLDGLGIFSPNALKAISGSASERPFQSENRNNRTVVLRIYQE